VSEADVPGGVEANIGPGLDFLDAHATVVGTCSVPGEAAHRRNFQFVKLPNIMQGKRLIRHDGKGTLPIAIVESGNIPAPAFGAEKAHDIDARCRLSGEVAPIELSIGTRGECASADLNSLKVYREGPCLHGEGSVC